MNINSNNTNSNTEDLSSNIEFNFETRTVKLNSGYEMPILGLGTWTQEDEETANSVYYALEDGYRLIDTAQYYGNEKGVGDGLKRAINDGNEMLQDGYELITMSITGTAKAILIFKKCLKKSFM